MKNSTSLFTATYWKTLSLLVFIIFASGSVALAQVDTTQVNQRLILGKRVIIETRDGSVIQGRFMGYTENGIRIGTESAGEIIVPNMQITSIKVVDEDRFKNGAYWFENPNATRYLFSPSAFSLKKGEGYYQNTYLIFNSFNYGVTDNFTIGGGFELISTFSGEPIFFITPKYTFKISEKVRAGTGVLFANGFGSDIGGLGIGYGVITFGTMDDNITAGLGYGFAGGELAENPIFTLSGMKRVSRRIGLVSENWFFPVDGAYGIFSYGLRFMGENITVDFAFLNNSDIAQEFIFLGIPYIDFVIRFGK